MSVNSPLSGLKYLIHSPRPPRNTLRGRDVLANAKRATIYNLASPLLLQALDQRPEDMPESTKTATKQGRPGSVSLPLAITLSICVSVHFCEKPRDLYSIRSGGQAKSAAKQPKLRKTTHASSPRGCEHADWRTKLGRESPLWGSKVATVLSLCTSTEPQDVHGRYLPTNIRFVQGNGYACVIAKSAAPSRQEV
jgi:hypothetical protein